MTMTDCDPNLDRANELFSEVIDLCDQLRAASRPDTERERLFYIAKTEAQTAQMWVAKAINYPEWEPNE
jgi:hypothetical protein